MSVWSRPLPYTVPGTREVCTGRMNEGVSETGLPPRELALPSSRSRASLICVGASCHGFSAGGDTLSTRGTLAPFCPAPAAASGLVVEGVDAVSVNHPLHVLAACAPPTLPPGLFPLFQPPGPLDTPKFPQLLLGKCNALLKSPSLSPAPACSDSFRPDPATWMETWGPSVPPHATLSPLPSAPRPGIWGRCCSSAPVHAACSPTPPGRWAWRAGLAPSLWGAAGVTAWGRVACVGAAGVTRRHLCTSETPLR